MHARPNCGHLADPGDRFCAECGTPLEVADVTGTFAAVGATTSGGLSPVGSGVAAGLAPGSAVLLVQRGPGEGTQFLLSGDVVTAGRSPEATLFLDDITVSRKHAEFRHDADGWTVVDAGSLNGTYVNRDRVDSYRLNAGDEVQIGKYRFVFLVGEDVSGQL